MKYLKFILEHIYMASISLIIALIISIILVYLSQRNKKIKKIILNLTTLTYAVPSLSFFSLMIPLTGLGKNSVIIVLVIYAQYILVRSFITMLDNFDKSMLLAANSMGLKEKTIFFKIKLPLLKNNILNAIRISLATIISIANIGAIINAGGIGVLIFSGLRTMSSFKILIGILLNALVYVLLILIVRIVFFVVLKVIKMKL